MINLNEDDLDIIAYKIYQGGRNYGTYTYVKDDTEIMFPYDVKFDGYTDQNGIWNVTNVCAQLEYPYTEDSDEEIDCDIEYIENEIENLIRS